MVCINILEVRHNINYILKIININTNLITKILQNHIKFIETMKNLNDTKLFDIKFSNVDKTYNPRNKQYHIQSRIHFNQILYY